MLVALKNDEGVVKQKMKREKKKKTTMKKNRKRLKL